MLNQSQDADDGGGAPAQPAARSAATAVSDLLQLAPHTVPYTLRVQFFRQLLALDRAAAGWAAEQVGARTRPAPIQVHRGNVMKDALEQLPRLGASIKGPIMVAYINEHGLSEPGARTLPLQ